MKYLICYSTFFILSWIAKAHDGYKFIDDNGPARNKGSLLGLHLGGILWLGVIPYFILGQSLQKIVFGDKLPQPFQLLIFILLIGATFFVAATQANKTFSKIQNRGIAYNILNASFITRYFIARFIFLCAYEIFFRGYLLTDCIHYLGIPAAILINVSLYTSLHIFSSKKEIIGCIPFGIALCGLSILFGAVWPAILLHLVFSFRYEFGLVNKIYKSLKIIV
jgi:membrane protease YdiL (CAAX protease family)